ncbi:radical SAM protein [Pectinatus sottacetonis]|uniref:radical SAM protein n=1 Tax=Pectinatus sottacetonis TaxID=1002795 RepID=UPI0018C756C8|nr:radical SAM protein [Pectinatus sottacetonis]
MKRCSLCPRQCRVSRNDGDLGFCGAAIEPEVALVSVHKWEEPCISGKKGAGTVFFSHCNMRCVFCQNYEISANGYGIRVSEERLAEIFLEQQQRNVECIELVTPMHYAETVVKALAKARKKGLCIPVVYNSNGYESADTIELFADYVDVFLPDLKYFSDVPAVKYSNAPDYFKTASAAIKKMFSITGPFVMEDKMMKKGVLVRHLILPWLYKDSIRIVKWLWENFGDNIYISLMNQYVPMYRAKEFSKINRKITTYEYQKVIDAALELGIKNCFVQERGTSSKKFVPDFNGQGVKRTV